MSDDRTPFIGWHRPDCSGRAWVALVEASDLITAWEELLGKTHDLPAGDVQVLAAGQSPDAATRQRAARAAAPIAPGSGPSGTTTWVGWHRAPGHEWKAKVEADDDPGECWLRLLAAVRTDGEFVVVEAGQDPTEAPERAHYRRGRRLRIVPQAAEPAPAPVAAPAGSD